MRIMAAITLLVLLVPTAVVAADAAPGNAKEKEIKFVAHRIGTFRGEACCVGDFNNDGKLDIVAGQFLYLAPDWKPRKIRELVGSVDEKGKGYYDDFANLAIDVDGDGRLDVVPGGWFSKSAGWARNPADNDGLWPENLIEKNGNCEHVGLYDLLATGRKNVLLPVVQRTAWYEPGTLDDGRRGFIVREICDKPMDYGLGVGDVNGDGRPDVLRPNAWFEAPADPRRDKWIEHPLALGGKDGKAEHTAQILVMDVNGDGLPDIIASSAHRYGIFWYEQIRENNNVSWRQHTIDDTWTQAHALTLADLDGDGRPELITGKRFMAHNGNDPDEFGPLGIYYYKLKPGREPSWTKHVGSFNKGIGAGMNIEAVDLDADGDIDLITTGKWGGPVWFENK